MPDEAAVMGVGNLIATCELAPVPLSSVAADFPGMGHSSTAILDDLMPGEPPPTEPTLFAPPGIITRHSTDALTFEDEHVRAAMRLILSSATPTAARRALTARNTRSAQASANLRATAAGSRARKGRRD